MRGVESLIGCLGDAVEEELQPRLPGAALARVLEQPVVIGAVSPQIKAEVEKWFVAVAERVNDLELDMNEARVDIAGNRD